MNIKLQSIGVSLALCMLVSCYSGQARAKNGGSEYFSDRWSDFWDILSITIKCQDAIGAQVSLGPISAGMHAEQRERTRSSGLKGGMWSATETSASTFLIRFGTGNHLFGHREEVLPPGHKYEQSPSTNDKATEELKISNSDHVNKLCCENYDDRAKRILRAKYYRARHGLPLYQYGRVGVRVSLILVTLNLELNAGEALDFIVGWIPGPTRWLDFFKDDVGRWHPDLEKLKDYVGPEEVNATKSINSLK